MMIPKFKDYLVEDKIPGGISNGDSPADVAKHHGISTEEIEDAIKKGTEVEMEHTDDEKLAKMEETLDESTKDFSPAEKMQQLKRREIQNKERYKAAQERGDNFAIKYYEFRMRLDKLDAEKAKIRKEIQALKKKFGKFNND